MKKKMLGHIVGTFGRQIAGGLIHLATLALVARSFGAVGSGGYAVAVLLPTTLANLFAFGVPTANVYLVGSRSAGLRLAAISNARIWMGLSVLGAIAGWGAIELLGSTILKGVADGTLWLALAGFPGLLLQNLYLSLLQARSSFREYNLIVILQPLVIFAGTAMYLVSSSSPSVHTIVSAYVLATWIVGVLAVLAVTSRCEQEKDDAEAYAGRALVYGVKAHLSNVLSFANHKIDVAVLNVFLGPSAVGLYVAASQLTEKLWLISQAVSTVALPAMADGGVERDTRDKITPVLVRWVLYVTTLFGICLASLANLVLPALFGGGFEKSASVMQLLVPGMVAAAVSRVLASDFAARGRPELSMYTTWLSVVLNIILCVALVPVVGLLGAAAATSCAYIFNLMSRLIVYKRVSRQEISKCFLDPKADRKILAKLSAYLRSRLLGVDK